jgi:hypothetical protein
MFLQLVNANILAMYKGDIQRCIMIRFITPKLDIYDYDKYD